MSNNAYTAKMGTHFLGIVDPKALASTNERTTGGARRGRGGTR